MVFYMIYEEQLKGGDKPQPFNYMVDDILYRLPWWLGDPEPPLRVLYPLFRRTKYGDALDPLTIRIGWTSSKKPFAYNPRYVVNPLVFIVGTPGAGKSATVKTIIYNLLRNEFFLDRTEKIPPVVVVDPEGEYGVLKQLYKPSETLILKLGRRDYINIFDRPSKSINPLAWYTRMLAVLQKFLGISPAQAAQAYRVLKRAIKAVADQRGFTEDPLTWDKPDITLEEVYKWIEHQMRLIEEKEKRSQKDMLFYRGATTLYTRLDQWMYPPNDAFSRRSTVDLSRLLDYKLIILEARQMASDLFGLFTYWIVYWFYGLMLEKGPLPEFGIRVVLILDEAWALLKKGKKDEENPLESLARRGRKYGILIIVSTQTPEDVDKKMFSLFGTLVAGSIPSDSMRELIVKSRGMPERFNDIIARLARGQLVWSINWARKDFPMSGVPIVVRTDYPITGLIQVNQ